MLNALKISARTPCDPQPEADALCARSKSIYFALLDEGGGGNGQPDDLAREASRAFLSRQLELAAALPCDLPEHLRALPGWSEDNSLQVGRRYREYLAARKAGGPRQYFGSKLHALFFLRGVAPTKLVDGAWLYGLLQRWEDARFEPLIRTYLEELGEGRPDKNHVALYRKLLAAHGCERWENLPDDHFTQGAIQLALAHHAGQFLPELIGYNLGYEQLPLHLLITAYELDELGIDPYYFTLHVTVDNAATGHARKSLQSVFDALPKVGGTQAFQRRLVNGYRLNLLGAGTSSVIASFDPDAEMLRVLKAKSALGAQLHSDYCRIGGRTVNDWLSQPAQAPAFLAALERQDWIRRGQAPEHSRFWRLIEGERSQMFGVFDAYERQVIRDWIAGGPQEEQDPRQPGCGGPRQRGFRAGQLLRESSGRRGIRPGDEAAPSSGRQDVPPGRDLGREDWRGGRNFDDSRGGADFDSEIRLLEQKLAASPDRKATMELLSGLMSPANHHTPAGLMATRLFNRLFA